jgi:AcrR family transcriptional regulator
MPRDPQPAKERILASAERLFAGNGFDGVSMREIAAGAGAQLALIHYHFGSKLDLYRAIWAARYTTEVAGRREAGFAAIDYNEPKHKLVRALVELYLLPLMYLTQNESLKNFVAIGARESTDPKEAERGILKEFLDSTAKRFLKCFGRALPELSAADVAWGYQAMLGASVMHIADRDRITRISDGAAKAGDGRAATKPMVEFCVGGWLALSDMRRKDPLEAKTESLGKGKKKRVTRPSNKQK